MYGQFNFAHVIVTVTSQTNAQVMVSALVRQSSWFQFTPLPDDEYRITMKDDAYENLKGMPLHKLNHVPAVAPPKSSMIQVMCPNLECRHHTVLPNSRRGTSMSCRECGTSFMVPAEPVH